MKKDFIFPIVLVGMIAAGMVLGKKDKKESQEVYDKQMRENKFSVPDSVDTRDITGYDYDKNAWITRMAEHAGIPKDKPRVIVTHKGNQVVNRTLTDEEIRQLRETQSYKSDGKYIYTPGRNVKTRDEEIQSYIDRHGEEIYESLEDKYGD